MGGLLAGVVSGGALSLLAMFALGVMHRYAFGPPISPFGDPDFFRSMSTGGLVVLILIRAAAAWLGSFTAVRMTNQPHATWTGPAAVMLSALATALVLGMGQPVWSLVVTVGVLFGVGWAVGRAHVGLPILPGLAGRGAGPDED